MLEAVFLALLGSKSATSPLNPARTRAVRIILPIRWSHSESLASCMCFTCLHAQVRICILVLDDLSVVILGFRMILCLTCRTTPPVRY